MNVKQLKALLNQADDDYEVVINAGGAVYAVYDDDTEEQMEEYLEVQQFGIVADTAPPARRPS